MKVVKFGDCLDSLPIGILASDGKTVDRTFEMTRMTGRIRMALGNPKVRDNAGRTVTKMLFMTLKKLGGEDVTREATVRRLSYIDRDYLQWHHYLNKLGDGNLEVTEKCQNPQCGILISADVQVKDLEVRVLEEDDYEVYVDKPDTDEQTVIRVFRFEDEDFGTLRVRLHTGADEERGATIHETSDNPEEARLRDLYAAVVDYDGKSLATFDDMLDLDENALDWMQSAVNAVQIGVSNVVGIICPDCQGRAESLLSPFAMLQLSAVKPVSMPFETKSSP